MAINFVKSDDIRILRDIEQYYSTQIDEMPMNGKWQLVDFCPRNAGHRKTQFFREIFGSCLQKLSF